MTFLTVDVPIPDTFDANGVDESLNQMFTVAILLTGNADRAECAVLEGINTVDRGPACAGAVIKATIRAAITQAMMVGEEEAREHLVGISWLPIELQRVLLLPKDLRHVFVLRLLLGLPRDQCSRLLHLDDKTLDELVARSAIFLAQRDLKIPLDEHNNPHLLTVRKGDTMMGKLDGKVAVVTGASKGIGAAAAKRLAAEGASVVVNYRASKQEADHVVSEIVSAGGKAVAVGADVSDEKAIDELFAKTKEAYGKLDILVNNAGVYAFGPIEEVTPEKYHHEHNLNVLGLILTTKAALPLFPAEGGSIINIGSRVNSVAPAKSLISSASKAAVDAITKVLSKELGPRKIRVNSLNPGVITTEGFIAGGLADSPMQKHYVELTPLGRMGEPDDVALPVVFLASDDSRWISGELIIVAGGE